MASRDIELMTTSEIADELATRCKAVVVLTLRSIGNGEEEREIQYRGGLTSAVGLVEQTRASMLRESMDNMSGRQDVERDKEDGE